MAHFEIARQEEFLDADLHHQALKLPMTLGMVSDRRLDFVMEAAPTFSSRDGVGSLLFRTKRGKLPERDSPENGDGGRLVEALGKEGINALDKMSEDQLNGKYRKCFADGRGIGK